MAPIDAISPCLSLVVDYLPCWDLSNVAAVCQRWRTVASHAHYGRIDAPWVLHMPTVTQPQRIEHFRNDPETAAGLRRLRRPKQGVLAQGDWRTFIDFDKQLREELQSQPVTSTTAWSNGGGSNNRSSSTTTTTWRFVRSTPSSAIDPLGEGDRRCRVDPRVARILPSLPLEHDLPAVLRHNSTTLEDASLVRGLLLLLVTRPWSVEYSRDLSSMGLVDRYQRFCNHPAWNDQEESNEDDDDEDEEEEEDSPGADVWGVLYRVTGDHNTTIRFVDAQRLASDDAFDFFKGWVTRSANGKVICLLTGREYSEESGTCIPMVQTFQLDPIHGFNLPKRSTAPLIWPSPCGLQDTYLAEITLTPAGDCMLARYEDLGNIDSLVFYRYDRVTQTWNMLWETNECNSFEGFFTVDGDFIVTYGGNGQEVPGSLVNSLKNRILGR